MVDIIDIDEVNVFIQDGFQPPDVEITGSPAMPYLRAYSLTEQINPELLFMSAQVLADLYARQGKIFPFVQGVPDSGKEFASMVALAVGRAQQESCLILPSRKFIGRTEEDLQEFRLRRLLPKIWRSPRITRDSIPAYTSDAQFTKLAFNMRDGSRILLVDDVLATGRTMIRIIEDAWREWKVDIRDVAVIVVKPEQGGLEQLESSGVNVSYVVRVNQIDFPNNRLILGESSWERYVKAHPSGVLSGF